MARSSAKAVAVSQVQLRRVAVPQQDPGARLDKALEVVGRNAERNQEAIRSQTRQIERVCGFVRSIAKSVSDKK